MKKSFDPLEVLNFLSDPENDQSLKENLFLQFIEAVVSAALKTHSKSKKRARRNVQENFSMYCDATNTQLNDMLILLYELLIVLKEVDQHKPIIRVKKYLLDNLLRASDITVKVASLIEKNTIQQPDPDFMEALRNNQV